MQRHVRWMISGMALVSLLVSASCGTEGVAPDVSEDPRPINCPEVAYVGDGAEPEGFDAAGGGLHCHHRTLNFGKLGQTPGCGAVLFYRLNADDVA